MEGFRLLRRAFSPGQIVAVLIFGAMTCSSRPWTWRQKNRRAIIGGIQHASAPVDCAVFAPLTELPTIPCWRVMNKPMTSFDANQRDEHNHHRFGVVDAGRRREDWEKRGRRIGLRLLQPGFRTADRKAFPCFRWQTTPLRAIHHHFRSPLLLRRSSSDSMVSPPLGDGVRAESVIR